MEGQNRDYPVILTHLKGPTRKRRLQVRGNTATREKEREAWCINSPFVVFELESLLVGEGSLVRISQLLGCVWKCCGWGVFSATCGF
ncbi:hypothetical protein SDJN02_07356, partial [Cucurbita argyrosperma subsp. argyrosperma]